MKIVNNFLKGPQANWRYILIVFVLATIVGGGILGYKYWWALKKEVKFPEVTSPEVKTPEEVPGELLEEFIILPGLNLETTKLADIPKDHIETFFSDYKIFFYSNGRVVVYEDYTINGKAVSWNDYYKSKEGKSSAVVNGKQGKAYDLVWFFRLSPDGTQLAYEAMQDDKEFVVVNGKEGKTYDNISWIVFSPDGTQLAYTASEAGKRFVVVNEEEGKAYDNIGSIYKTMGGDPRFSPDGTQLAYIATKEGKQFVVVNGKEGRAYDEIGALSFSPDGTQVVYVAKQNDKEFIVVNGKEVGVPGSTVGPPVLSSNGTRIAYVVRESVERKFQSFVVVDERAGKVYDYIDYYSLKFTSDGKIVYVASRNGGWFIGSSKGYEGGDWFIVLNGEEGKTYDRVGRPFFSPDGTQLAYIATKEGKQFVVVNEEEGKSYDAVSGPVFSPDGSQLAYIVSEAGKQFVVLNGEEDKAYDNAKKLSFSSDGKKIAYEVSDKETEKRFIVVNGKESKAYDFIYKHFFSPDSKYIAYGARDGNELWWIVEPVE